MCLTRSVLKSGQVWNSKMVKKGIGKVSGGSLRRGMIVDPFLSGFGFENGGPGGSKSEQKMIEQWSRKWMDVHCFFRGPDPAPPVCGGLIVLGGAT